jgi:regulator of protease activity HflC (stomatin/prohibitin superfamily)
MKKLIALLLLSVSVSGCGIWPPYHVWESEMDGKAELSKAEYNTKVAVQEALAKEQAATHLASAEIARAEGVAKANAIIGDSLKNNEAYLRWLYIEGLKENPNAQIIYLPTEAGLPILEAGRKK